MGDAGRIARTQQWNTGFALKPEQCMPGIGERYGETEGK